MACPNTTLDGPPSLLQYIPPNVDVSADRIEIQMVTVITISTGIVWTLLVIDKRTAEHIP